MSNIPKILVLESGKTFFHVLKKFFDTSEIKVDFVYKQDIDTVIQEIGQYHLIVLEYAEALDLFNLINKKEVLVSIPVIVYKEAYDTKRINEVLLAGASDVLWQKMNPDEIKARVYTALQQGIKLKEIQNELNTANSSLEHMEGVVVQYDSISADISFLNDHLQKEIDERKRVENSLKESETQLKEAVATKDRFFSIIAHDLRNPFNVLIGFSEILLNKFESFDDEKKKLFLSNIKEASERTFVLLQELLDWSRSQMGQIVLKPESLLINELVQNAITPLEDQADSKAIILLHETLPDLTVRVDKNMIITVIRNLVSNAIKFTPKQGRIEVLAIEENNDVKIIVRDNGVGIPEKDLPKLFRIDEKIKTNGTDNETGTGLGLILCKEFIEKNNGTIWVESKESKGSDFIFTLKKA